MSNEQPPLVPSLGPPPSYYSSVVQVKDPDAWRPYTSSPSPEVMSETDRTTEDGDGPADIEAQHKLLGMSSPAPVDVESAVSTATKFSHLAVYFLCNVALTIYNKLVLGQVSLRCPRAPILWATALADRVHVSLPPPPRCSSTTPGS